MQDAWTQRFTIRHYELDPRGNLSFVNLCRMLQESAAQDAERLQASHQYLAKEGLAWVLSKFHVRVSGPARPPRWNDTIRIETWRSGLERLFVLRDYRVHDPDGRELATATSFWSIIDVSRRKLVAIPEPIATLHPMDQNRALPVPYGKLPAPENAAITRSFHARLADIDENQHVNNVSFISWVLETVPEDHWKKNDPAELEIIFRAESLLGDAISSKAGHEPGEESRPPGFLHLLTRDSDGRELARARTRWSPVSSG
jgi:medium-chain acyl-[acyl-carrier-protein] hydrolase